MCEPSPVTTTARFFDVESNPDEDASAVPLSGEEVGSGEMAAPKSGCMPCRALLSASWCIVSASAVGLAPQALSYEPGAKAASSSVPWNLRVRWKQVGLAHELRDEGRAAKSIWRCQEPFRFMLRPASKGPEPTVLRVSCSKGVRVRMVCFHRLCRECEARTTP